MRIKNLLKDCCLPALVILLLVSCLNPISFDPDEVIATINANITGELGIYDSNNAVLWVINKTKTVTVNELTIDRNIDTGENYDYARMYSNIPAPGQSLATYHRPARDRNQNTPYYYTIEINVNDPISGNTNLSTAKQLPLPSKEYAVFLVRMRDGSLQLVDQESLKPDLLDPEDTAYETLGPGDTKKTYPLIVRNRTSSAVINSIVFGQISHGSEIKTADQYGYYMPAAFYKTVVNYTVEGDAVKTVYTTASLNVQIIQDTVENSQSSHLLFLDFYKTTTGGYRITQSWPDSGAPGDCDDELDYHGNFEIANVMVHNQSASYTIYAVGARRENPTDYLKYLGPEYVIDYTSFYPQGVIVNNNNKTAGFKQHPNEMLDFTIPYNAPYTINIYLTSRTWGDEGRGFIVVPYPGYQIFPGKTIDIDVTEADVANAMTMQGAVQISAMDNSNDWDITIININIINITVNNYVTNTINITFDNDPGELNETLPDPDNPSEEDDFWLEDNDGEDGRGKGRIVDIHRKGWVDKDGNASTPPSESERFKFKFIYEIKIEVEITGVITIGNRQRQPNDPGVTGNDPDTAGTAAHKRRESSRKRECYVIGKWTKNPDDDDDPFDIGDITTGDSDDIDLDDFIDDLEDVIPPVASGGCESGKLGVPVTSVQIKKGTPDSYNMNGPEWQDFQIEILPKNASNKDLLWSKGILVYPGSVDFQWEPPVGDSNVGTLRVKMTSQYREKKDQLPREANKLDMMVWAANCTEGITTKATAPQNYSREEGVLFVTGATTENWNKLSNTIRIPYENSDPGLQIPLYSNPPSLDDWNNYFKNKIDKALTHQTDGKPYSQPKVKIKIE